MHYFNRIASFINTLAIKTEGNVTCQPFSCTIFILTILLYVRDALNNRHKQRNTLMPCFWTTQASKARHESRSTFMNNTRFVWKRISGNSPLRNHKSVSLSLICTRWSPRCPTRPLTGKLTNHETENTRVQTKQESWAIEK